VALLSASDYDYAPNLNLELGSDGSWHSIHLDANEDFIKPFCEFDFEKCQKKSEQNLCDTTKNTCYENPPVDIKCQVAFHMPQLRRVYAEQGLTEEKCMDPSFCFSDYKEYMPINPSGGYEEPGGWIAREFKECASKTRREQNGDRQCTDKESQAFGEIVKAQGPCGDSECACLQKVGKHLKDCYNKEAKLNFYREYSQCPIVWPAKGEKKCMSCSCSNWDKATATYSNCRPYTMYTVCPGSYCVKCKSDGKTPMPGQSGSHETQCKAYETSSAEAELKEMLRELLF